jgi:hypothetical protein
VNSERLKVGEVLVVARRVGMIVFSLFTIHYSLFTAALAQDDPPDLAPPPLRIVSREELDKLATEDNDIKARTKMVIEMMGIRLTNAEKMNAAENFEGMYREVGHFHALMENGIAFLEKRNQTAGKVLDNYKRLEITLRGFITRLETIRRTVPIRYEDYLRKLIKFVREARTRATEPLFGDSVVKPRNNGEPIFRL